MPSNININLNRINSKFNELVSNRSKISKRDIKELIYFDKNTEELVLQPSSPSDLKARKRRKRRRGAIKHYETNGI